MTGNIKFFKGKIKKLFSLLSIVGKEIRKDKCFIRASSLAYSSLLAIVPLFALVFALFTAFGAFNQVQTDIKNFIVKMLVPTMHQDFLEYINSFINNSKTLGIAGLLIFAITSISLIDSISENFNAVWGSSNRRSFIAKFTSYSSVIVFGTLFIGASFAISHPIRSLLSRLPEVLFLFRWGMLLLPSILIFTTFMLMISAIPAGKVSIKSSILGALSGTILWDLARWIFVNGTNYIIRMSVIYGSLAAIPIFLLWLYIIWLIVLSSLEITYVHQYHGNVIRKIVSREMSPSIRIINGLDLFFLIADNFIKGGKPYSVAKLAYIRGLSLSECEEYLKLFLKNDILYVSQDSKSILPVRDPGSIKADEILKPLIGHSDKKGENNNLSEEIFDTFMKAGFSSIREIDIKDLLYGKKGN